MAFHEEYTKPVRTPRLYRCAANVYRGVLNHTGSLKGLVHEAKHPNKKGITGLVCKALQNNQTLDSLIEGTEFLSQSRVDDFLGKILIAELLWGKGAVSGDSTAVKVVRKKEEFLRNKLKSLNKTEDSRGKSEFPLVARWARVNTLLISFDECLRQLEELGWEKVDASGVNSREEYVDLVKSLGEAQFVVDMDFPTGLAFPGSCFLQEWTGSLVEERKLLLQDKASFIPPTALKPRVGSHVIDACAAPGLKTLHLAEILGPNGRVTAVEMDEKRCDVLREFIKTGGASIVEVVNNDFLSLDPSDFADVEYIMVDPSCSGSGIARREGNLMNEIVPDKRLQKLSGFQVMILLHALSFPSVKRVVYSTCSIMKEENENVVRDVLSKPGLSDSFKLKNFGKGNDQWERVCDDLPECRKTSPGRDLCNGFFVAVFERRKAKGKKNK